MIVSFSFEGWEGNAEELAETAGRFLAQRGLADDGLIPNVRLIRDYSQRGVLQRPTKEGKEARYRGRHLLEFIAARILASDGWPLAKIAEHIGASSDADLLSLIPGEEKSTSALSVARRLLREGGSATKLSRSAPAHLEKAAPQAFNPKSDFRQRAARSTGLQAELRDVLRKLVLPEDQPAVQQVTLIAIATWCQLLIQSNRLPKLTVDEAEEIGRAVTASLLNPAIRKGVK